MLEEDTGCVGLGIEAAGWVIAVSTALAVVHHNPASITNSPLIHSSRTNTTVKMPLEAVMIVVDNSETVLYTYACNLDARRKVGRASDMLLRPVQAIEDLALIRCESHQYLRAFATHAHETDR